MVWVFIVMGVLLAASSCVPIVRTAGICAFVPCDPGPKDAVVGLAADGVTPLVAVSPCGRDSFSGVRLSTTDERHTVLWSVERVAPGSGQVVNVLDPGREFRVIVPLAGHLPDQVAIQVTYPRGLAESWSQLAGVKPGRFGLFSQDGSSLDAFNAQADEATVCRWYTSPIEKAWPIVAVLAGGALLITGTLRRRSRRRTFERRVLSAFGERPANPHP